MLQEGDREAEQQQRRAFTRRVRRAMDFDGEHVHYCSDSSLAQGRKGRRTVLRYFESFVEAGSKEAAAELLAKMAARKDKSAYD